MKTNKNQDLGSFVKDLNKRIAQGEYDRVIHAQSTQQAPQPKHENGEQPKRS